MINIADNMNLNQNEIQNARIHILGAAPSSPVEGQFYYDAVRKKIGFWNGSIWVYDTVVYFQDQAPCSWSFVNGKYLLNIANVTSNANGLMIATDKIKLDNANDKAVANTIMQRDINASVTANVVTANRVSGLALPQQGSDAVNLDYLNAKLRGIERKPNCRAATIGNIALTGLQTIDGISVVAGDKVLVWQQTNGIENGIYTVSATAWTRAEWLPNGVNASSVTTIVSEGNVNKDTEFMCLSNKGLDVVGISPLQWDVQNSAGKDTAGKGMKLEARRFNIYSQNAAIVVNEDDIQFNYDSKMFTVGVGGLSIADAGIDIRFLAANVADQKTIVGGKGTPLSVQGYTYIANTTVVRTATILASLGGGATTSLANPFGINATCVIYDNTTNQRLWVGEVVSATDFKIIMNGLVRQCRVVMQG
jgi:hypothetical protein